MMMADQFVPCAQAVPSADFVMRPTKTTNGQVVIPREPLVWDQSADFSFYDLSGSPRLVIPIRGFATHDWLPRTG